MKIKIKPAYYVLVFFFLLHIFQAFCHLFCMKNFMDAINTNVLAPKTAEVMRSLCQLYGVHGILENLGEFMHVST
jgi:acyl-CoA oxidase